MSMFEQLFDEAVRSGLLEEAVRQAAEKMKRDSIERARQRAQRAQHKAQQSAYNNTHHRAYTHTSYAHRRGHAIHVAAERLLRHGWRVIQTPNGRRMAPPDRGTTFVEPRNHQSALDAFGRPIQDAQLV